TISASFVARSSPLSSLGTLIRRLARALRDESTGFTVMYAETPSTRAASRIRCATSSPQTEMVERYTSCGTTFLVRGSTDPFNTRISAQPRAGLRIARRNAACASALGSGAAGLEEAFIFAPSGHWRPAATGDDRARSQPAIPKRDRTSRVAETDQRPPISG